MRIQREGRLQPAEHGREFVVGESKFASTTVLGNLVFSKTGRVSSAICVETTHIRRYYYVDRSAGCVSAR